MQLPRRSLRCPILLVLTASAAHAQSVETTLAPDAPAVPTAPQPARLTWEWGETKVKFGGYVKADLIHDFDEIGSADSFDPRTIPTDDSDGSATRMHARSSRLNLDVVNPSTAGPIRVFVEGDFFSDQNGFRLRHAYGTVGSVLAGQTWTTFMDEDCMPETLDYESPIAFPIVRQAQVRWTQRFDDAGDYVAFALEDPDSDIAAPVGVDGDAEEPLPDLNARLRLDTGGGHVQLSSFLGMAEFDPDVGSSDDVVLWGLNLSLRQEVFAADEVYAQITYGDGVGRYRGGITAAPDADGDLEAITTFGALLGYEHHWSDEYRSTVSYSWGDADVPDGAAADANEQLDYLAANLIWQFADRAWTGIEYLHGRRETFDGSDGEANRIQFSIRFDL